MSNPEIPADRSAYAVRVLAGSVGPYEAGESFRAIELGPEQLARLIDAGAVELVPPGQPVAVEPAVLPDTAAPEETPDEETPTTVEEPE